MISHSRLCNTFIHVRPNLEQASYFYLSICNSVAEQVDKKQFNFASRWYCINCIDVVFNLLGLSQGGLFSLNKCLTELGIELLMCFKLFLSGAVLH